MKRISLLTIVLLFALALPAMAGKPKIITLKDGSTISGSIVGINNNHYVVNSPSIGEIMVKVDDVVSMTSPGEIPSAPPPSSTSQTNPALPQAFGNSVPGLSPANPYSGQIQSVQSQIMSDPKMLGEIQTLAQDPDMMAALSDPAFVQAIKSGDVQSLQGNSRLQLLMNNPHIQTLIQKLKSPQQQ